MTDTEYTKIAWSDVQPGDILMHENGDRLTVEEVSEVVDTRTVVVAGVRIASFSLERRGFTPHRPVPSLDAVPDTPGAYLDKDGIVLVLTDDEDGTPWRDQGVWRRGNDMHHRAPFTRLVPMPSSDAVREVVQRAEPMCMRERITDAVMSLLSGEANSYAGGGE